MILRSLVLQNFRSYGENPTRLDLEPGVLLFEGDIGSGKSSILYAVEFALFGLGESEARSLIRVGAERARVELAFEASGSEYVVVRTIERKKFAGKTTQQQQVATRGWLRGDSGEEEQELSPTELKARVLQILNFRENPGRSSSRIYRFAVFTPQELMREVLWQKPDERVDTLRRAFGIEDYAVARSNAEVVLSRLEREALGYSRAAEGLAVKEAELEARRKTLEYDEKHLLSGQGALARFAGEIEEAASALRRLEAERERVLRLEPAIAEIERGAQVLQAQLSEARSARERTEEELASVTEVERKLPLLRERHEIYDASRARMRELERDLEESREVDKGVEVVRGSLALKERAQVDLVAAAQKEIEALEATCESYAAELARLPELERRAERLRDEARDLPIAQGELEELRSELGALDATAAARRRELEETGNKFAAMDGLREGSECPLCRQRLTPEHLGIVVAEFKGRIQALSVEEGRARSEAMLLRERGTKLEQRRDASLQAREELSSLEREAARMESLRALLGKAEEELQLVRARLGALNASLASKEYVREEQRELAELRARREQLEAPLQEYARLKKVVQELENARIQRAFHTAEGSVAAKPGLLARLAEQSARITELEGLLAERKREVEEKKSELEGAQPLILEYAKSRQRLDALQEECAEAKSAVDRLLATTAMEREALRSLQQEVGGLRERAAKAALYGGFAAWLEGHFLPAIEDIESHVLSAVNEEFNQVFQRWFSMLVTESEGADIAVAVDDRFTPLVEESGYELDVDSLSGGERTAIALAYRLALNHMVKRANEAMQTNLMILDEPTEGFSKEQMYRLRGVLQELDCDQVILVSHERDLEALADRVYRVEKIGGESTVTVVS